MGDTLNLFPRRAAIGRTDAAGNVYMSEEFERALASLLVRVGGPVSTTLDELALDLATHATAAGSALARQIDTLEQDLAQAVQLTARLAELRKHVAALEAQLVQVAPPTDWEHPGAIGARTANSGQFTTVNRVKITAPAGSATLTLADGKTLTVANSLTLAGVDGKTATFSNTLTFSGTDGAVLNVGGGGTLGSAAYSNTGSFAARSGTALPGAATDPATTQSLVNAIRGVLLSVGIGS